MAVNQTIRRVGSGSGAGTLDVIPSGSRVGNPAELLFGGSLEIVLEALATLKYDHVIIDGPPMLAIADAHALAEKADSLLLVSRPDRLTVEQAVETRERLTWLHTNVLGLVVCGRFRTDHAYGYVYAQESARVLAHGANENGASEPRGSARRGRGGRAHRAGPDKPEHEPGVAPVERIHEGAVRQYPAQGRQERYRRDAERVTAEDDVSCRKAECSSRGARASRRAPGSPARRARARTCCEMHIRRRARTGPARSRAGSRCASFEALAPALRIAGHVVLLQVSARVEEAEPTRSPQERSSRRPDGPRV